MEIKKLMTRDVECIPPEASIKEAAQRMKDRKIGSLPVMEGSRVVGMVTDRDIALRAVAEGQDPSRTSVEQVMTRPVVVLHEMDKVEDAARIMAERQVRRLPILDNNEELIGIVSLGDLAVENGDDELSGETLKEISQPGGAAA